MKKKSLLGILAVLMVFALALTGCGQQGEQNAGATGSESRNEAISNENNPAGEVTTEPGDTDVGEGDNRKPEMRDGYYVYEVLGEEFLCETNVWDYIDEDTGTFDFRAMKRDLGLYGDYNISNRTLRGPGLKAGNPSEVYYDIVTFENEERIKAILSEEKLYRIKYSPSSYVGCEYVNKSDSRYGFTFDLIILTTYGAEQLKKGFDTLPLGDHLLDYYNEQNMTYELP
jgi:hypothetical protein